MREVHDDREGAERRAQRGYADIRRTHSVIAAGAMMAERLSTIAPRSAGGSGWEAPAALERAGHADAALHAGPRSGADSRGGRTRRFAGRLALRLMRPYTAHQASLDRAMLDALLALGRDVRELGERAVSVDALGLGGLRAGGPRPGDVAQDDEQHHAQLTSLSDLPSEPKLDAYPPAPAEPWSHEYNAAHAAFVGHALDDAGLIEAIRGDDALPGGYGRGFDERVVEFPWLAGRNLGGKVLDAGSTLNHLHVLRRLRPLMDDLHIVTLAAEDRAFPGLGVSYLFADLRSLPFGDDVYDRVVSLSTLEHVGLDLEHFGADGGLASDPQEESLAAADELRRVLRPGGDVLLTVPVGVPERFGWVRTLSLEELDALVARFDPVELDVTFFRHEGGWRSVDRDSVGDARYRDHLGGAEPRNGVVAAEAVACVALTAG